MTFKQRGQDARPEELVDGWPSDYWEGYQHPTRQAQLEVAVLEPWQRLQVWTKGQARDLPGFLFYGLPGYGKTGTGLELLNRAAHAGFLCRFITAEHLAAERESTSFNPRDGKTTLGVLMDVLAPEILMVDDVGTREYSAPVRAMLFDAVRERLSHGHLTILTTNLPLETPEGREHFSRAIDARVLSTYTGHAYNSAKWGPAPGSLRSKP